MSQKPFSLSYIKTQTAYYTKASLESGKMVSPDEYDKHDGRHPETGNDLETPSSFLQDMIATWTLDIELTEDESDNIESVTEQIIYDNLPDELKQYL